MRSDLRKTETSDKEMLVVYEDFSEQKSWKCKK